MDYYDPILLQQLAPMVQVHITDTLKGSAIETNLIKNFEQFNINGTKWDSSILKNRMLNTKYIINYEVSQLDKYISKDPSVSLSPFSSTSELYPNGILNVQWFKKYTNELPFVIIQTFELDDDDDKLIIQLNEVKAKCQLLNIKFMAIVVGFNIPDERIVRTRNLTNLPKLGLLYIDKSSEKLSRDSELVVTSLLSSLKYLATDFYTNIEFRIKQRQKKYYSFPSTIEIITNIELAPKFLETRNLIKQGIMHQFINPHNLEISVRLLEIAYQNMIDLVRENFTTATLVEHDLKLYNQFRLLIDVLAFHITRGYFSLEDPLSALKKHSNHIRLVLSSTSEVESHQKNWLSIQYEWLAQLMDSIPQSVLLNITLTSKRNEAKKILYFGGVKLEKGNVPTKSSTLYLSAVENLRQCTAAPPGYLFQFKDEASIRSYVIDLLERTASSITLSISQNYSDDADSIHTLLLYINWLIAEEYFLIGDNENIKKAIKFYNGCLNQFSSAGWGDINKIITAKLLSCYDKVEDFDNKLGSVLKLSMLNAGDIKPTLTEKDLQLRNLNLNHYERSLKNFLNYELLIVNPENPETYVFDEFVIQLQIKPGLEVQELSRYFWDGCEISLVVDEIVLSVDSENTQKDITIKHDSIKENSKLSELDLDDLNCNLNLDTEKIIKFNYSIEIPGSYAIKSIKSKLRLLINGTELTKQEEYTVIKSNQPFGTLFFPNNYKKQVRVESNNALKVSTLPPKLELTLDDVSTIIIDEKLSINVKFDYLKNPKIKYSKFFVTTKLKVGEDEQILTQVNWDSLKDDEPLDIRSVLESGRSTHVLNVSAHKSVKDIGEKDVSLDFKCHVEVEGQEGEVVYDILSAPLTLVYQPFQVSCVISPRYREGRGDMPSPFFLRENEVSMPIVTRVWKCEIGLQKLVQGIEVLKYDFSFKSANNELTIAKIDSAEIKNNKVTQLFCTRSKSGYTHRNVLSVTSLTVEWKRNANEADAKDTQIADANTKDAETSDANTFTSKEWEITLPLSDPRLLLKASQENGITKLKYILENPTPRIFTFTSELEDDKWDFTDDRNLIPEKQNIFPVLPFSQHEMEFYGKALEFNDVIQLPNFKVFDVQYKVGLPTLSVSDGVVLKDNQLVLRRHPIDLTN